MTTNVEAIAEAETLAETGAGIISMFIFHKGLWRPVL